MQEFIVCANKPDVSDMHVGDIGFEFIIKCQDYTILTIKLL